MKSDHVCLTVRPEFWFRKTEHLPFAGEGDVSAKREPLFDGCTFNHDDCDADKPAGWCAPDLQICAPARTMFPEPNPRAPGRFSQLIALLSTPASQAVGFQIGFC